MRCKYCGCHEVVVMDADHGVILVWEEPFCPRKPTNFLCARSELRGGVISSACCCLCKYKVRVHSEIWIHGSCREHFAVVTLLSPRREKDGTASIRPLVKIALESRHPRKTTVVITAVL
jgi:hypothetical protein